MRESKNFPFLVGTLLSVIVTVLVFYFTDYITLKGFNPSDDGVVLAQSFRILNGEIPHKDFVSIRPVMSGIIHCIHFFSPLPLVVSGRVFVVFQFFTYSFIWAGILSLVFGPDKTSLVMRILSYIFWGFAIFFLNMPHFLMPWTTIDAMTFAVPCLLFLFAAERNNLSAKEQNRYYAFALLFISLSSLTRQSFFLPVSITFCWVAYNQLRKRKYASLTGLLTIGAVPYIVYFLILIFTDALPYFVQQMTGRTELFKTGVQTYKNCFVESKVVLVHICALGLAAFRLLMLIPEKRGRTGKTFSWMRRCEKVIWLIILIVYFVFITYECIWYLFSHDSAIPLELFWVLVIIAVAAASLTSLSQRKLLVIGFAVVISWVCSLSIGANSPWATTGILASTAILVILDLCKSLGVELPVYQYRRIVTSAGLVIITIIISVIAIYGQLNHNYRDLPSRYLNYRLGDIFSDFGGIKTNLITYNYYRDFRNIYYRYEGMKGHLVFVPNNAIIYPLLKSRNPFPIDWLQGGEYVGSEEYVLAQMKRALDTKKIYVVVDKFDSKYMAQQLKPKRYDAKTYGYMPLILQNCQQIPTKSKYFVLFTNRK